VHSEQCQCYLTSNGMPRFTLAQVKIVALFKMCQHQQRGVSHTGLFRRHGCWPLHLFLGRLSYLCRSVYIGALTRECVYLAFQMLWSLLLYSTENFINFYIFLLFFHLFFGQFFSYSFVLQTYNLYPPCG
jgi:hypothetical protein